MILCNIRHTEAFAGRMRPACQCLDHSDLQHKTIKRKKTLRCRHLQTA